MIKLGKLILVFLLLAFPGTAIATADSMNLQQTGEGSVYYLGIIKVYDAKLYRSIDLQNADILSPDVSKCLHLTYSVDLERDIFIEAADKTLSNQFSEAELDAVRPYIDTLHQGYQSVEDGDIYTLCYSNENGETILALNDTPLVTIASPDFSKVYFSIWLGKENHWTRPFGMTCSMNDNST